MELAKQNIPPTGLLSEEQAMTVLRLAYPNVPDVHIKRTAIICHDFGLHPLLKEIHIIPFKNKSGGTDYVTVLGIQATRKMMARFGSFSYVDNTPRVMTEDEQMAIFGEVYKDRIQAITKLETKGGLKAQGYGSWLIKDNPYGTDKGNTKANMAFIRSERQAFSRLYPDHQLPDEIEIMDENYIDEDAHVVPENVDEATGEIVEAEAVEQTGLYQEEDEDVADPFAEAVEAEVEPEPEEKDESLVQSIHLKELKDLMLEKDLGATEMIKWCNAKPREWNITSAKELKVWQYEEILNNIQK